MPIGEKERRERMHYWYGFDKKNKPKAACGAKRGRLVGSAALVTCKNCKRVIRAG